MGDTLKHKDHKYKRKPNEGNSGYITTSKELKNFAKQVEAEKFGDKQFEKAYNKFKAPAYGMREE
jgi:hypothetical protein